MTQPLIVKLVGENSRKAFTLIEMMVALAVASVLMVILMKFVQIATSTIVLGEDRLYATNDAQAAMDLLTSDLQSVKAIQVPISIAGTAQGSSVEVAQGFGNGSNAGVTLGASSDGKIIPATGNIYPMDLYLLATPPASYTGQGATLSGAGTPHLIRYKLVWQDPISQGTQGTAGVNPVMALYRDFVSSSATFGLGATSTGETSNSLGIAGLHDLYSNYWGSSSVPAPPVSDLLVSNIFDFQILLYDVGGQTPNLPLNLNTTSSSSESTNFYYQPSISSTGQTFHLSSQGLFINSKLTTYSNLVAEIRMTLLNQQGVTIFNTGGLSLNNANMAAKYAHVYIRRVPISL